MIIDCKRTDPSKIYFTLIQLVIPRPIAWVLSENGNGSYNLAPFSFFNAIASNPPMLMISIGWKDETTRKDTWINIDERNQFVVHIPSVDLAEDVNRTATVLPYNVSEIDQFKIPLEKMQGWPLPRIKNAKAAFLCEKYAIHEIGDDPQALILGKINQMWFDDAAAHEVNGRLTIDPLKINPLARLGGNHYAPLGPIITIKRPDKEF